MAPTPREQDVIPVQEGEERPGASSAAPKSEAPSKPIDSINYLGRYLILVGLTPAAIFGIAVGATTVVLRSADATVHLGGIALIWGASTIVCVVSIIAGMRGAASYCQGRTPQRDSAAADDHPAAGELPSAGDWTDPSVRYQSLKSIKRDDEPKRS